MIMSLITVASVTFYFGITEPLMVFERFFFLQERPSLLTIIWQLWYDQSWPLAILIGLFSVVLPMLKLAYLSFASIFPTSLKQLRIVAFLGSVSKWSMLDVLVVAIVIVAAKTSGLAKAIAQPGLWYFTISVVLMALLTLIVQKKINR